MSNYPKISNLTFGIEVEFLSEHQIRELADSMNVMLSEHGMKIQVAGYTNTSNRWRLKPDASVGGRDLYGAELVSPILRGDEGLRELEIMLEILNKFNPSVNSSCGLHVHLGANEMNYDEVISVMDRYSQYESLIDKIMPNSRRGNNNDDYCGSVGSNYVSALKRNARKTKRSLGNNASRWKKVNLDSINKHGTIEFRHHSGTTNFEKISNWLSFLMSHVEVSKKLAHSKRRQPAKARKTHHSQVKEFFAKIGWEMKFHRGMSPKGMNRFALIDAGGMVFDYIDGILLDECYESGIFSENLFKESFNDIWLAIRHEVNVEEESTQAVEEIDAGVFVDDGWLMDVDEKVVDYMNQRQLELNS